MTFITLNYIHLNDIHSWVWHVVVVCPGSEFPKVGNYVTLAFIPRLGNKRKELIRRKLRAYPGGEVKG